MNNDPLAFASVPYEKASKEFATNLAEVVDSTQEPLYDYLTYPAAGATNFRFFAVGIGGAKTIEDTNMLLNGQLGNGEGFLVQAIAVDFIQAPADFNVTDDPGLGDRQYRQVMEGRGSLTILLGSTNIKVQQAPLKKFPMMQDIESVVAISTTLNATTRGYTVARSKGRPFIPTPFSLVSGQPFSVTINFPVAIPIASEGRIGINLYGTKYRNVS